MLLAGRPSSGLNADEAKQQEIKWGEGGLDRTLLHTLAGGLDGGLGGALGALTSSEATPTINKMLLGTNKNTSPSSLAYLIAGVTAAGIGYAAGGISGAGAAINQIYNNDFVDIKTGKIIPARCKAGDTSNGLPCVEGVVSALVFSPQKSDTGIQVSQITSANIEVLSLVPPNDIAKTWQVDANGDSTGPVTNTAGYLVSLPTSEYLVTAIKTPYPDGYNPNATQETPVTIIDSTTQGVKSPSANSSTSSLDQNLTQGESDSNASTSSTSVGQGAVGADAIPSSTSADDDTNKSTETGADAPSNTTPWYKTCGAQASGNFVLHGGLDAVSSIPGFGVIGSAAQIGIGIGNTDWTDSSGLGHASQTSSAAGATVGLAGFVNSGWGSVAKLSPKLAESIPGIGIAVGVVSVGLDAASAINMYNHGCPAGN